jgi:hypothetical protein
MVQGSSVQAGSAFTITHLRASLIVKLTQSPPFRKRDVTTTVATYQNVVNTFATVDVIPPPVIFFF